MNIFSTAIGTPMLWLPHDSELARIEQQPDALLLHFAVLHVEQPDPDHPLRAQSGYLPGAMLRLPQPQVRQWPDGSLGRITQGRVQRAAPGADAAPLQLTWPLHVEEPIELELGFAHGARLHVTARGLRGLGGGEMRASCAC